MSDLTADTATLADLTDADIPVVERLDETEAYLQENDGVFASDEQAEEYDALLQEQAQIEYELTGKFDRYAFVIEEAEGEIKAIKGRESPVKKLAKSFRARRRYFERKRDRMKGNLLYSMQRLGIGSVEGDWRIRRQANGGRDRVDLIGDLADVPEEYIVREPALDEEKTLAALKGELGEQAQAEAEKVARIRERGEHVRIY